MRARRRAVVVFLLNIVLKCSNTVVVIVSGQQPVMPRTAEDNQLITMSRKDLANVVARSVANSLASQTRIGNCPLPSTPGGHTTL